MEKPDVLEEAGRHRQVRIGKSFAPAMVDSSVPWSSAIEVALGTIEKPKKAVSGTLDVAGVTIDYVATPETQPYLYLRGRTPVDFAGFRLDLKIHRSDDMDDERSRQ